MYPTTELSFAIDYPVGRHVLHPMAIIERPTYHACGTEGKKIGNSSVGGDPAYGNAPRDFVDEVEVSFGLGFSHFGEFIHQKCADSVSLPHQISTKVEVEAERRPS